MVDAIYEKLAGALNARSLSLPSTICNEFFDFISFLFTPEDAAIFVAMPLGLSTIQEIAEYLPAGDLQKLAHDLEIMENRGLIHITDKDEVKLYEGLALVPGIVEIYLMSGIVDERHKKLAVLLHDYHLALAKMFESGNLPQMPKSVPGRKVQVEREIFTRPTIVPYKELKELIMKTEYISAGTCVCRHHGALLDNPCTKPVNNCMLIGEPAEFSLKKGFARRLTREEAVKLIDQAEDAALIHTYANATDFYIKPLCNCCQDHCTLIKIIKSSPVPSMMVMARYLVEVNGDDCTGCEACIARCQMEALKMVDGSLTRDEKRCIGCGLCMWVCPTEALTLKPLPASKIPLKS
ncbi:MAG: 4Fe-4S binding protein [Chloroflexi bacterium]|nr:4Fe-4S binding protein [Chloroflexota bacterium]